MDMQQLADQAAAVRSRVTISSVIGRDVKLRKMGREWTAICPFHTEKRDGAFMVNDAKGIYKCFSCGAAGDVIEYVQQRTGKRFTEVLRELSADVGIDFRDAKQKAEFDRAAERRRQASMRDGEKRQAKAKALWLNSARGAGTPAQAYLEGRGVDFAKLGRWPGAIRFRHDCWSRERGGPMPAMVSAIVRGSDIIAVHRTFLERDRRGGWTKASLAKPKLVLGDYYGGSIVLHKGAHDTSLEAVKPGTAIVIGEGIEDGLTVAMSDPSQHVRAAIALDNIGNIVLPPQAGDFVLLGQRDQEARMLLAKLARDKGDAEAAAHHERCARDIEASLERAIAKQQARGREDGSRRDVRCAWPSPGFKDFNDELRGIRMEGA